MLEGVAAAFLASADSRGRLDADFACLEIDEASARHVFRYLRPDLMILTNLFRDQLDRYGEIDLTMGALQEAIRMAPSVKLVINGDDPLTAYLAEKSGNSYVCFGVSERCADPQGAAGAVREGSFCEYCGSLLHYDFFHFSQLGVYHCPSCGFKRPKIRYDASGVRAGGGLSFAVNEQNIESPMRGFYNVYNLLAAWAALKECGCETDRFNEVLRGYKTQFGRGETFEIGRTRVLLNLAKNPAGFDQNISAVLEDRTPKDLIIAINDNAQDGRDISWLWDVDFDRLGDETVRSITVGGTRALDMRLRLKYAGLQAETADEAASARKASVKARERDPEAALEAAIEGKLEDGCGNLYVLVNYTALYKAHEFLRKNG
jgi:UDP-N-acetylmuramyl tripeptide synthase